MKKIIILLIAVLGLKQAQAQDKAEFKVDTLKNVTVLDNKKEIPFFTTFTKKIFGSSQFTLIKNNNTFYCPLAIKMENYNLKTRIDSVQIKCKDFDTRKVELSINVFTDNKLVKQEKITAIGKKGNVYTLKFKNDVYLPFNISYFSYSFTFKEVTDFVVYTNKNIDGYLYSYNVENNVFKIIEDKIPNLDAPQIKIFYTVLE